jgi:RNA polymerase sigma-70 factor (ECF subfamily)
LVPPTAEDRSVQFHDDFVARFETGFPRLFRFLDRLSGDPELAADLAQEAFVRLYRRQSLPDAPDAWLITVAMNLLRNARSTSRRRLRLLGPILAEQSHSDPAPPTDAAALRGEVQGAVRAVLEGMEERDRQLLLLCAEGFSYRDMAKALGLHEASVGSLLARARQSFRERYRSTPHAP